MSGVSVWGQVAKLYRDASLGNAINIMISHIIVLSEDQVSRQQTGNEKVFFCYYLLTIREAAWYIISVVYVCLSARR